MEPIIRDYMFVHFLVHHPCKLVGLITPMVESNYYSSKAKGRWTCDTQRASQFSTITHWHMPEVKSAQVQGEKYKSIQRLGC